MCIAEHPVGFRSFQTSKLPATFKVIRVVGHDGGLVLTEGLLTRCSQWAKSPPAVGFV